MDAKTLEALKASIAKWEKNAEAKTPDAFLTGPDDCPLCCLFLDTSNCEGCPIFERTNQRTCGGSPYQDAYDAWDQWAMKANSLRERVAAHDAARIEVAFLKSLLPAEEE